MTQTNLEITRSARFFSSLLEVLNSFNDWPNLVYNGGAIGDLGVAPGISVQTSPQQELTSEMDAHITKPLAVAITGPGTLQIPPGASTVLTFSVTNQGTQQDTYIVA
jgi:hypothetical protein